MIFEISRSAQCQNASIHTVSLNIHIILRKAPVILHFLVWYFRIYAHKPLLQFLRLRIWDLDIPLTVQQTFAMPEQTVYPHVEL